MPTKELFMSGESLPPAPPWLEKLSTVSPRSNQLMNEILNTTQPVDTAILLPFYLILNRIVKTDLSAIFGNSYDLDTTPLRIDANELPSLKTTEDYLQFVRQKIYDLIKQVIGDLHNGAHRSADPEYLKFFAKLCEIKDQLEDLLFE